jgi:membrane associated rhomboid family serine protease
MTIVIVLFVLLVIVIRVMTPEQRVRARHEITESIARFRAEVNRPRPDYEPFREALTARTPRVFVTPALIALNVVVFLGLVFSPGQASSPETLIAWGANWGPSTTNGQWWRLVTAMFVQGSVVALLISMTALLQTGLIVERLLGHLAFAAAYFASGLVAAAAGLSRHPVDVTAGASGAVAGLYGVMAAILIVGRLRPSAITMPPVGIRRLVPLAVALAFYSLTSDSAELAGFLTGVAIGGGLVAGIAHAAPAPRRVGTAFAVACVIVIALVVPRRGIVDARPQIAELLAIEHRTATAYDAAVDRFKKGRTTVEALVKMIEQTIEPELHAAGARLKTLDGVPPNQEPLVANAREFVRLRGESWRLRAEGLKQTNMGSLRQAERTERESFDALEKIAAVSEN